MDDDQILARGGDEYEIEEYAKSNGANLTKNDFISNCCSAPIDDYGTCTHCQEGCEGVECE